MNIGEFLNTFATGAGIAQDNAELKALVITPELSKVNLPDDIANRIQSAYMTEEQAKNNSNVKKYFTAISLNPVDATINELLASMPDVSDDDKQWFANEKNSYAKIKKLPELVAKLESKKGNQPTGESAKAKQLIEDLNKQILADRADREKAIKELTDTSYTEIKDMAMENFLRSYNFGTGMPDEVNITTAKVLLQNKLAEKKAALIYDKTTRNFGLYNAEDQTLHFTENNLPVQFKSFTDKILADSKMLKVAGAPMPAQQTTFPDGLPKQNNLMLSQLDTALADVQR